jgi:transcription antitermination factor NusG
MNTLSNVETRGGESLPPGSGLAPDVFPLAINLAEGVSVDYVHDASKQWYVFRATYGREDKASDFLIADGTYTYIAKRCKFKVVHGRRRRVLENLIPNLLFVYTTQSNAEKYIKYTPALAYLTYYYDHSEHDEFGKNPPMTISCREMENFIRATTSHNEHLLFVQPSQCHYKSGDFVKVVDGPFCGVEGRVARVSGQQRVVLSLSRVGLVSTAYVPTAFIEKI